MFEYNMTKEMAMDLIKKSKKKVDDRQKYLIDCVNEGFGLLYPVTKVNITL